MAAGGAAVASLMQLPAGAAPWSPPLSAALLGPGRRDFTVPPLQQGAGFAVIGL